VDVVADSETVAGLWAAGGRVEDALEVVFGNLDVRELVVVIGVEVEVRNNISERLEHGLASCVAGRVGWAHVCGVLSKDVAEGHLVLDHLVVSLGVGDDAQVLVRPGVAGYLMAFGDHTTDDVRPLSGGIDCTLADVDSCHEKGGLETVCGELIKYAISVDVWSVIVCDGDSAGSLASVNPSPPYATFPFCGRGSLRVLAPAGVLLASQAGPKSMRQSGAAQWSLVVPQYPYRHVSNVSSEVVAL
jgi:hypothetical protein